METKEAPIKSNMIEAVLKKQQEDPIARNAEQALFPSWESFERKLGIDLEGTAKETKAFQRKREISSSKDLLRLILFYVTSDWSLRLVGTMGTTDWDWLSFRCGGIETFAEQPEMAGTARDHDYAKAHIYLEGLTRSSVTRGRRYDDQYPRQYRYRLARSSEF